jgi:putative redox protein
MPIFNVSDKKIAKAMKLNLERIDQDFHMKATNEDGISGYSDGATDIGGHNLALRPMQMMLAALGSCSAIDVILLLRKQRHEPEDIKIEIDAKREETKRPAKKFTDIHVHYKIKGDIPDKKIERAVNISMGSMCSVKMQLDASGVNITWSWERY